MNYDYLAKNNMSEIVKKEFENEFRISCCEIEQLSQDAKEYIDGLPFSSMCLEKISTVIIDTPKRLLRMLKKIDK